MHYFVNKTLSPSDCLILGVFKNQVVSELSALTSAQQESVNNILQLGDFSGKAAQISTQYLPTHFDTKRLLLVGLGDKEKYSLSILRKALNAAGKTLTECQAQQAQILFPKVPNENDNLMLRQSILSLEDAHVRRDQLKTQPAPMFWPEKITFVGDYPDAEEGLMQGELIANAIKLAKNLGNLPANHCTPSILAERAVEIAKKCKMVAEIYDEAAIKTLNMNTFLSVAQGSVQPPRLIVLRYEGAPNKSDAPVVFVGKGVTFDTGGISLKSPPRMDEMKYDMCGAASVLATLQATAQLSLPLNVIGVIVATENMPSGTAIKPGDVVTSMSGKTIEILNTDAEGRLILCDALTFVERFHPAAVIDIATLTGAIIMTFGGEVSGLMSNQENLAHELEKAGKISGDRVWPLPIFEEYQELINTAFADVANLGGEEAKSITAACFLARFAEKYPWAHLDIAGTAWRGSGNMGRAATGRPVVLLMQYLLDKTEGNRHA